jgi:hypothetical protein
MTQLPWGSVFSVVKWADDLILDSKVRERFSSLDTIVIWG